MLRSLASVFRMYSFVGSGYAKIGTIISYCLRWLNVCCSFSWRIRHNLRSPRSPRYLMSPMGLPLSIRMLHRPFPSYSLVLLPDGTGLAPTVGRSYREPGLLKGTCLPLGQYIAPHLQQVSCKR